jgi:hypothetical protein
MAFKLGWIVPAGLTFMRPVGLSQESLREPPKGVTESRHKGHGPHGPCHIGMMGVSYGMGQGSIIRMWSFGFRNHFHLSQWSRGAPTAGFCIGMVQNLWDFLSRGATWGCSGKDLPVYPEDGCEDTSCCKRMHDTPMPLDQCQIIYGIIIISMQFEKYHTHMYYNYIYHSVYAFVIIYQYIYIYINAVAPI